MVFLFLSGFGHGSNIEKSFVFQKPINLKPGVNHISLLGMTVGLPVRNMPVVCFLICPLYHIYTK